MSRARKPPFNTAWDPKLSELDPDAAIAATVVAPDYRGKGVASSIRRKQQEVYSRILTATDRHSNLQAMNNLNTKTGFKPVMQHKDTTHWFWAKPKQMQESTDLLPVPPDRQQTKYTCGTSSMASAMKYFGITPPSEKKLARALGTDAKDGTDFPAMQAYAEKLGLQADLKQNQTLRDLKDALDAKTLPIVAYQAWPAGDDKDSEDWKDEHDNGHYSVVRGVDEKDVILMDPSVPKGGYMRVPHKEFVRRWHDKDTYSDGKKQDTYYKRSALYLGG